MSDVADKGKDHMETTTAIATWLAAQEAIDAQHWWQSRIEWTIIDYLHLQEVGNVWEQSMTPAELMQEVWNTVRNAYLLVELLVELRPQYVVVDPMHMQSQQKQRKYRNLREARET